MKESRNREKERVHFQWKVYIFYKKNFRWLKKRRIFLENWWELLKIFFLKQIFKKFLLPQYLLPKFLPPQYLWQVYASVQRYEFYDVSYSEELIREKCMQHLLIQIKIFSKACIFSHKFMENKMSKCGYN